METNIAKLLVETTTYGSAHYRGVIQSETDKTFVVMPAGCDVGRRVVKDSRLVILPAGSDIEQAIRWFAKRYSSFRQEVLDAETVLADAKRRRSEAALEALKAGA